MKEIAEGLDNENFDACPADLHSQLPFIPLCNCLYRMEIDLKTKAPLPTAGLLGKKRVIGAGDPVVVYGNRNHIDVIWVTPGKVYDSKMGIKIFILNIMNRSDIYQSARFLRVPFTIIRLT